MRRWLLLASVLLLAPGCVYYNGVYNAKSAAKSAELRLQQGGEGEAATLFQQSAAKAESVLVRFPTSTWRTRALYLAGRGGALGGQCETAVGRLTEFLAVPAIASGDRDRARIALAACDLRSGKVANARLRLDSIVDAPDASIARQARLWAARAALADGDRDAVTQFLRDADENTLPWELILSSLSAHEYVRVESLLVQRAMRLDYRDDVPRALREMWSAGQFDGVEAVTRAYDGARVRDANRAAIHFAVGDLNLRSARDSMARQHLGIVRTLAGRDSVLDREAAARLTYLTLTRAASLRSVDSAMAQQDSAVRVTPYAKRVSEQLLLVRLLAQQEEATGAALYLAAEVARDSLRANALARSMFLRVARDMPGTPLAPQAYYAAGLLQPDSAEAWAGRIRSEYPTSAVAAWLRGDDPATSADFASNPPLLQVRWSTTLRVWSDSVRKLRLPTKATAPSAGRP